MTVPLLRERLANDMLEAIRDVIASARLGHDVSGEAIETMLASVRRFGSEWQSDLLIPKVVAAYFIEARAVLSASSEEYGGDARQRLADAATRLGEEIAIVVKASSLDWNR